MPSPTETELRIQDSPVPTQTVFGLEGSIVTAPMDWTGCLSKTGLNRVPPSSDFQTPPLAAPTKTVVLPSTLRAATAATRPLMTAEPMLRAERPERTPESKTGPRALGGTGSPAGATGDADGAEGAADRRARGRELEEPVVHFDVRFRALDRDAGPARLSFSPRLDREGKPDSGDLLIAAQIRLGDPLGAAEDRKS